MCVSPRRSNRISLGLACVRTSRQHFPKGCKGVCENRLRSPTWPLSFRLIFLGEIWGWKEDPPQRSQEGALTSSERQKPPPSFAAIPGVTHHEQKPGTSHREAKRQLGITAPWPLGPHNRPLPPIGVLAVERQSPGRPPGARWPSTHACPWDSVLPVGAPVLPRPLPGTPLPREPVVGGRLHTGRGPSAAPGAAGPGLRFWGGWKQRRGGVGRPGAPQPGPPSVLRGRFSGGINARNTMPVGNEVVGPRCRGGGGQGSQGPPGRAAHLPGGTAGAGGRGAALSPVRAGQSRAGPHSSRLRGWSRIGPGRTFAVPRVPTPVPKIPARLLGEPGGAAASQIGGLGCRPVCTAGFPAPPRPAPGSSRQPGSAGVCCGRSPAVVLGSINLKRAESVYIKVLFCGAEATLLPEIHFYGSIRG